MFRHQGKTRTFGHNLKIASLLSCIAGMVNVTGFLAVQRLTTNVTGHFAFFVDEIIQFHFEQSLVYFLFILFFFLGSFISNSMIEIIAQKDEHYIYIVPALVECLILFMLGFGGQYFLHKNPNTLVFSLLFAMGLQNALVTSISKYSVRTTHLTGLFTDLGIELSQLFFYKAPEQKSRLYASIKLRLTIISFFFLGGIVGGILYAKIHLRTLILAGVLLTLGLIYDTIKYKILVITRKIKQN